MARYRHGWIKAAAEGIARALTGNWHEEHLFLLRRALAMYGAIANHLTERDVKPQALLTERSEGRVDLGRAPRVGSKPRPEFAARQSLATWAAVDLTRINRPGVIVVMKLLSEIGPTLLAQKRMWQSEILSS